MTNIVRRFFVGRNFTRRLFLCVAALLAVSSDVTAQTVVRLYEFSDSAAVRDWRIVNDGVMGGLSSSRVSAVTLQSGDTAMRFVGNISLRNNGGFASVRSAATDSLGLDLGKTIAMRIKGDGRRYTLTLYPPDRRAAFSYQMDFATIPGQWSEVNLPVNQFVAHSFGRPLPNAPLQADRINSIGILLADKQPGSFELLVDWIDVR